jgi:HAD superfamily hydrolase (TIGR01509 family)
VIDAVLLDLGNVLVFHDDALLLERLSRLGGRPVPEVAAALAPVWRPCHLGQLAEDELRAAVARAAGAPLDRDAFLEVWNCHFRVHDEVMPLVESLFGRVKVLLLSNTNASHFEPLRPRLPILERFDDLVLSYRLGLAKPDRGIFEEALRRAGTAPERTVFFDDVKDYVEAARAAGLRAEPFTDAPTFRRQLAALGLAPAGE